MRFKGLESTTEQGPNFPLSLRESITSGPGYDFRAHLVTFRATCPKVLFTSENQIAMMLAYAKPLLLPAPRKKPRYAARHSVCQGV